MNHRSASRRQQRERRVVPAAVPSRFDDQIDVWEALEHLSVAERAVVFLLYWEDLSQAEAANRLGVSVRTVGRRHVDARQKLMRLLHD